MDMDMNMNINQEIEETTPKKNSRKTAVKTGSRSTEVQTPTSRKTAVKTGTRSTEVKNDRSTDAFTFETGATTLNAGDVIDGYEIIDALNVVSGQAFVYIAKKDGQKFALKHYKSEESCIDKAVVKILQESISHPNIIKVVASGVYNERFYTVTPYYSEGAVIDHLDEIDPVLLKKSYIPQLNEALHAIHQAGIFHCDIKPHNFYFANGRKELVIGDFGIALSVAGNPSKESKIGTYIPKRELQKREATMAYLSGEGDEYAASWVDYYALGMSILNMAHGRDVYEDVDDATIRDELMNNPIRVSESVDSEVAMLAVKLLDGDNVRRIGYDGVKKWCTNTSCYGKYRHEGKKGACTVHIENAVFDGTPYYSTEDYVEALAINWDKGLRYYQKDGILNDISRVPEIDRAIIKEFAELREAHSQDERIGFALTLMRLNPAVPFRFEDINFSSFSGYVDYLGRNYKKMSSLFFNEDIILQQIENEGMLKRISNVNVVLQTVRSICSCKAFTRENKMEMIRNYFTAESNIILNQKQYAQAAQIAEDLFENNMVPAPCDAIFNNVFLNFLTTKSAEFAKKETELKSIFALKNSFARAAKFSLFLTNVIPCHIDSYKVQSISDILEYAKILYEEKKSCTTFVKLLRNGSIAQYYAQFERRNNDLLAFLNSLKNFNGNDQELLTLFYNQTQEEAVFLFKNKKIVSLQNLFDFLAKQKNLHQISAELLSSNEFRFWMEGNGYDIFEIM